MFNFPGCRQLKQIPGLCQVWNIPVKQQYFPFWFPYPFITLTPQLNVDEIYSSILACLSERKTNGKGFGSGRGGGVGGGGDPTLY